MVLLACVGGLTLLACACAFAGVLLYCPLVSACPLLRLFVTADSRATTLKLLCYKDAQRRIENVGKVMNMSLSSPFAAAADPESLL